MKEEVKGPPKWMDKIIEWYCRKELLEDLQGDLHEYYYRNLTKGRGKANLVYLLDVIKFCRLYTIQKPKILGQMTFFNLMGNYFKTSTRSIARNKLFSSINIIGLSVAMSVGLLMISYIGEALTFDEFHTKKDRIYRVTSTYADISGSDPFDLASSSVFIGEALKEKSTGLEEVLILRRNFVEDISKDDNVISVSGHYSSEPFFNVFSFKLKAGNPSTALKEPYSLVLTQTTADKLFPDSDPVGQVVNAGEDAYTVTGVMEDAPRNSHVQFEALASLSTIAKDHRGDPDSRFFEFSSIWRNHVYVLLEEGTSPSQIEHNLNEFTAIENAKTDRYSITHQIENLREISPGRDLSNQIGPSMTWVSIYRLGGLTLIILLSACFNYTNLSIARSLRRAKEVGLRKVVGASRAQVFTQFVFEAVIIALLSLVLSVGLFLLLRPEFVNSVLDGENITLAFRWSHVLYFVLFAAFIGILSGILPSIFLSKLKAISILTDVTKLRLFKGINLRRVLIVFQFAISMVLIIGATITYRQYLFSINYDLGIRSDNILNLQVSGNDPDLLKAEMEKLPEVQRVSRSAMVPSTGDIWAEQFKYKDPLDSMLGRLNWVDKEYPGLHDLTFLAGSTFPRNGKPGEEPAYVIIDRNMSERLGFEQPADAVGETLMMLRRRGDISVQIIGVIENYMYANLESDEGPTCLVQGNPERYEQLNLLVQSDDLLSLMDKLESVWVGIDKLHPFQAEFMDVQIQQTYEHYRVIFRIFTFLAVLAISISAMGLLGMAVFTTETRLKEISVRKVLGASERNLVYMLSRGFLVMLVIAAAIAMPLTYYFFTEVVLAEFTKQIDVGAMELLPGAVLIFGIGLLTIGWQTTKAAKTNPAEMLRDE